MVELQMSPTPGHGTKAQKVRRRAVIVSNDGANETARRLGHGVITIVPVISSTERTYPFQTPPGPLDRPGPRWQGAEAEQIRWVDVADVAERVAMVPPGMLMMLNDALRLHLAL